MMMMMIEVRSMGLIAEMLFLIASFMSVIFSVRLRSLLIIRAWNIFFKRHEPLRADAREGSLICLYPPRMRSLGYVSYETTWYLLIS